MKLIEAINNAIKGNWVGLEGLLNPEDISLIKAAQGDKELNFEKLWMQVKSLLFIKECRRPEKLEVGERIVVLLDGQLIRGEISRLDTDPEWRNTHYAWHPLDSNFERGRMQALRTHRDKWGVYNLPIPDFKVQMEYYLKNLNKVENIGCCYLYRQCTAEGRCVSRSYEEYGVKYDCALARRFKNDKQKEAVKSTKVTHLPVFSVEETGQLTLF